jgi:hypothetical protein
VIAGTITPSSSNTKRKNNFKNNNRESKLKKRKGKSVTCGGNALNQ